LNEFIDEEERHGIKINLIKNNPTKALKTMVQWRTKKALLKYIFNVGRILLFLDNPFD